MANVVFYGVGRQSLNNVIMNHWIHGYTQQTHTFDCTLKRKVICSETAMNQSTNECKAMSNITCLHSKLLLAST